MSTGQSEPARVEFLTAEDLLAVVEHEVGSSMVRDYGLLAAAEQRPRATVFGEPAYPGLAGKAAALLHSLVTSHPLIDGNKRVGLLATLLFYGLNGVSLVASDDELFDLIMEVADGSTRDVSKIAAALHQWERPL